MSTRAKLLAACSLPAGLVGYLVAGNVIVALGLQAAAGGLLVLFIPLFVAGLCMLPLVVPLFDELAKRDLAARPPRDQGDGRDG